MHTCRKLSLSLVFTIGVERTSANHALMILASLPVFTGGIAHLSDRKLARVWWIDCVIALAGEALLIGSRVDSGQTATVEGDLIVPGANTFATLCYVAQAAGSGAKDTRQPARPSGVGFGALLILPLLPFVRSGLGAGGFMAWSGVLYLAAGVTIVGYILWYHVLGKGGIARMGAFPVPAAGLRDDPRGQRHRLEFRDRIGRDPRRCLNRRSLGRRSRSRGGRHAKSPGLAAQRDPGGVAQSVIAGPSAPPRGSVAGKATFSTACRIPATSASPSRLTSATCPGG